jgi:hypothetical protein
MRAHSDVMTGLGLCAIDGCDDCCHMDIIAAKGMGEMVAIAEIKRKIFELDPHHLIWGSIACREIWCVRACVRACVRVGGRACEHCLSVCRSLLSCRFTMWSCVTMQSVGWLADCLAVIS